MNIINDMFKTDGKWDSSATGWALLAWILVVATFIGAAVHNMFLGHVSLQDIGIGAGAVLAGGGGATWMHSKSTP
jgi:hypothetical protein